MPAQPWTGAALLARFDSIERKREYARVEVVDRRLERLTASASGFFRGAPGFFYDLLRTHPDTKKLLGRDRRWIIGDVHLENVGVAAIGHGHLVWDFNDLDETCVHSPALDVIRGAASASIGALDLGYGTSTAIRAAEAFVLAYGRPQASEVPRVVSALIERAAQRTTPEMLDERCPIAAGARHFVIGRRYLALRRDERRVVNELFVAYSEGDPLGVQKTLHLADAAFRVQGTGSLGVRRFVMLVRIGKHGEELLLEAKEMQHSAVEVGRMTKIRAPRVGQAGRVVLGMQSLLAEPLEGVRALAGSDGRSYLVRKHAPGEDKLALDSLHNADELISLARAIGARLSRAHARSAATPPPAFDPDRTLAVALDLATAMTRTHLALAVRAGAKGRAVRA